MDSGYRAVAWIRYPPAFSQPKGRSKGTMSETRKRTVVRPVRFTPEEWAAVQAAAEAAGMNAARFLRTRALGLRTPRKSDETIRQLIAVGNNLNQLARSANIAGQVEEAVMVAEVLGEVMSAVQRLG